MYVHCILLFPMITSLIYGEKAAVSIGISIAVAFISGFLLTRIFKPGIKVIYAKEKYFIVMPSRKNPDGTYRDIVHPINATFRNELEEAVIAEFYAETARAAEAEAVAAEEVPV